MEIDASPIADVDLPALVAVFHSQRHVEAVRLNNGSLIIVESRVVIKPRRG